jgi:hypothetical protein
VSSVDTNNGRALAELRKLKLVLETITKERDLLKEREMQHLESLKVMKEEVNLLTLAKISCPAEFSSELEQLRMENELFASQIIDSEVEMRGIRTLLECLDAENNQMRKDLEAVRGEVDEDKLFQKRKVDPESSCENWSMSNQVQMLSRKLQDVESLMESLTLMLEEERRVRADEIKGLKVLMCENRALTDNVLPTHISTSEDVEVTMEGFVNEVERKQQEPTGAMECGGSGLFGKCACCLFT